MRRIDDGRGGRGWGPLQTDAVLANRLVLLWMGRRTRLHGHGRQEHKNTEMYL